VALSERCPITWLDNADMVAARTPTCMM
jgi:hypothetical protein